METIQVQQGDSVDQTADSIIDLLMQNSKPVPIPSEPRQLDFRLDVLRQQSAPVIEFDARVKELSESLVRIAGSWGALGISAIQVGVPKRVICVLDVESSKRDKKLQYQTMVNPQILDKAPETSYKKEGCLSYPGLAIPVHRSTEVTVRYQTVDGEQRTVVLVGDEARCVQHEVDHLDGVLFVDHLNRISREAAIAKWKKALSRR